MAEYDFEESIMGENVPVISVPLLVASSCNDLEMSQVGGKMMCLVKQI